ncbi:unnamed protein product [Parnassius mnemosyne]|uniref:Uncharacterized protein n=1 Tax=Parnassius mnemosyne TaxID=213953 RepID=A0AAV1KE99_9NEOP
MNEVISESLRRKIFVIFNSLSRISPIKSQVKNLIVLLCAIGCACATVSDQEANIVRSNFDHDAEGGYQFAYETDNGITAQADGKITVLSENSTAHQVQGSVSYVSPEGKTIEITYVADENGYRPEGSHIPQPQPIPELILRSLEYIAAHPPPPAPAEYARKPLN